MSGTYYFSKPNPLYLVLRQPFLRPVVELGRTRAFMRRHLLRVFQRASVCEVRRDPRRPKRMIADRRENADRHRPPANRPLRVRLSHWLLGQRVMARHDLMLSAVLVQAQFPPGTLRPTIFHFIFSAAPIYAKE